MYGGRTARGVRAAASLSRLVLSSAMLLAAIASEVSSVTGYPLEAPYVHFPPTSTDNKKILLVSAAFRGHAIPLLNLGAELADRGYDITFASHDESKPWFDEILSERRGSLYKDNGTATFASLGKFPYPHTTLTANLKFACEEETRIWGMLHLLNTVYMPLIRPMQTATLALFDDLSARGDLPTLAVVDAGSVGALHAAKSRKINTVVNAPSIFNDITLGGSSSAHHDASFPRLAQDSLPACQFGTASPICCSLVSCLSSLCHFFRT